MRKRAIVGLGITAVFALIVTFAVRWAYGAYEDDYQLAGLFPRAGQGLVSGSDVKYRGVNVGEVDGIELVDRQARITFSIEDGFNVPEDVEVTVRPKTIFGEKYLEMVFPSGEGGPYLEEGDEVATTAAATEVENFFEAAEPLFEEIDEQELASLITTLADTSSGLGDDVARGWESGAAAASLFNETLDAQLTALDSWSAFQDSIRTIGPDINEIGANNNLALEEFNRAREDFVRALETVRPFADHLADLIIATRPDFDRLMVEGDNVMRVLISHQDNISEIIEGLSKYVMAFATGLSEERLADGSGFAFFKVFVFADDIEKALCEELAQAPPEFTAFRDAVLGLGGPIDCAGYFESSPEAGPATPVPPSERPLAAQQLADDLYGLVGQVDQPQSVSLDALVNQALAGGPQQGSGSGPEAGS